MKLKIIAISFFISLLWIRAWTQPIADVAIYADTGTWRDGITALRQFLSWKGLTYQLIYAHQINKTLNLNRFKIIIFPGGYAAPYNSMLDTNGLKKIRKFIATGHAYLGICAGAYFAADKIIWQDTIYNYKLKLFHGFAIGPVPELAPWPYYTIAKLQMNLQDSINRYEPAYEYMLYYGGPYFSPTKDYKFDTIATYSVNGKPAIIRFNFGKGRVLLIGTHPEIEEDSDRDSTSFAQELNDYGSDWNFLWSAFDYLLNRPITQPAYVSQKRNLPLIYPNPTHGIVRISTQVQNIDYVKITSIDGKLIKKTGHNSRQLNLESVKPGIYIVIIKTFDKTLRQKLIVL